jgi:hypothetical protein
VTTNQGDSESLSGEDVDQFVRKLDAWSSTLDAPDRALLQVILERAGGNVSDTVDLSFSAREGVGRAVEPYLRDIASNLSLRLPKETRPQRPRAWVQDGEPWVQSG